VVQDYAVTHIDTVQQGDGPLLNGNIQIHPQIASHVDTCPVPSGSCAAPTPTPLP
jgi:hypothetical protein